MYCIYIRDVKQSSNFQTSNYVIEFEFEFLNSEFETKLNCTKTDVGIEALLSHNVCQRDAVYLLFAGGCRLPLRPSIDTAAVDAAGVWLPLPTPHFSLTLQSRYC